jgi:hypothetical protein
MAEYFKHCCDGRVIKQYIMGTVGAMLTIIDFAHINHQSAAPGCIAQIASPKIAEIGQQSTAKSKMASNDLGASKAMTAAII